MKLFFIPSSAHLADRLPLQKGVCSFTQFSDGEWHITVHDEVDNQEVLVLAQTGAPAATIIQVLLLCDALRQAGARISLIITYFGYARQDRLFKGEPLAAQLMSSLLKVVQPERIDVIHIHNTEILKDHMYSHIPYDFFYECVEDADIIVSPDKGARILASHIAHHTKKEVLVLEKQRPLPEQVMPFHVPALKAKRILIVDDMITTGTTVIKAADALYSQGAHSVCVAATHGVFSKNAPIDLQASSIEHITITNTLEQHDLPPKISVHDCAPYIERILKIRRETYEKQIIETKKEA